MKLCNLKRGIALSAIVLLTIASNARADIVAHWRFDEASGTTAADSGPNGYHGTAFANATFVPGGMSGNALSITSAGGGYVRMVGAPLDMNGKSFTLSAWVKTTASAHQIAVGRHFATVVAGYFLAVGSAGAYGVPNKGYFYQSCNPGGEPIGASDVNTGAWKLLTATYEQGGLAKIYVDGVLEKTKPNVPISQVGIDFCVGAIVVSGVYTNTYDGLIDDVQIYDRALSDNEVAYLFAHPGAEIFKVAGHVLQNSLGVPGVVVDAEQNSTVVGSGTTDANGDYSIENLAAGTYTIRPRHNDKVFFPSTKDVNIAPDALTTHFTAGNIGPVSILFQYPVIYADQSRQGTLGLNVVTPVARQVTMSDNSFKLTSPVKVTIPAGQRTANFFVYGVTVAADTVVTVTATHQGLSATQNITVRPKPVLQTMTLAKITTKGGYGVSGTVTIDQPAIGPMGLYLSSNNPSLVSISPGTTAFYNGASSKAFYCKTLPVATQQVVTITATFYGSTKTVDLTLTP